MVRTSNRLNVARKAARKTDTTGDRKCKKDSAPPPPPTHISLPLRDARGYLQRIYTAIDQIYKRGRTKPNTHRLVGDTIIQARCARVLAHLQVEGRAAYLHAIRAMIPSLDGQANFIARQMLRMGENDMTRRRFSNFVDGFGFLLLSVCAHSNSFRTLLETASLPGQGQAHWRDLCNLIESHAYSIELYARTRGLDWNTPLTEGSNTWDQLICRSLYDVLNQHGNFTENQVLGISDTEYCIRHELPDSIGHYHEWVVSSKPRTAYNPTLTYRIGKGESSRLVTARQVNIDSSIILGDCEQFRWPKRTGCLNDDPRSRGPASDPCEVCPDDVNNNNWAPQQCDHTLAQLCRLNHSNIAKASSRVELLHYSTRGVGVRALKAFRRGEIMAEYVGEIYPSHIIKRGRRMGVILYRNDDGISYQYGQTMEDCIVDDDQESKKKTTSSPEKGANGIIIDPAIRGNWSRYMNHSCREATNFDRRFVGDKVLTLIVAERDIQFDEEVTVNYGPDYWEAVPYGCVCREDRCTSWDPVQNKVRQGRKVTWEEEAERRRAAEEEAVRTATKKQNKKPTQTATKESTKTATKKPVAQGEKETKTKPSGAKSGLRKRRKGAEHDGEPPTKKARTGIK